MLFFFLQPGVSRTNEINDNVTGEEGIYLHVLMLIYIHNIVISLTCLIGGTCIIPFSSPQAEKGTCRCSYTTLAPSSRYSRCSHMSVWVRERLIVHRKYFHAIQDFIDLYNNIIYMHVCRVYTACYERQQAIQKGLNPPWQCTGEKEG